MKLWQRLWLLFTVIWVVVSGLNAATIVAFSDEVEWGKAVRPAVLGVAVPALLYLVLWAWHALRSRKARAPGKGEGR